MTLEAGARNAPARLRRWAEECGYSIAFGAVAVLDEVRILFGRLRGSGELNPDFTRGHLDSFQFSRYSGLSDLASLIVVAVPRPTHTVTFVVNGREFGAILPPTYHRYAHVFNEVREDLLAHALPCGVHLQTLAAPLKSIAVRVGLVQYGGNNLVYRQGFGSYFQLAGYLTDVDLGSDICGPMPPRVAPLCARCHRCQAACPTGAIDGSRFLLRAERCLTLFSENPGEFPANKFPTGDRCLVGCLECQKACPLNKGRLRVEPTGVSFTEEETAAIISAADCSARRFGEAIHAKLRRLALFDTGPVLSRNLRALVARWRGRAWRDYGGQGPAPIIMRNP